MHPLKKARLDRGMSLSRLAKESNCSHPTVHAAESGKAVSELTAFKLAGALGQDPAAFVRLLCKKQDAA